MRKRGFSLVELLITIGLLSLIAVFVLPTYQLIMAQFQLSEAAQQVESFIRLTQQKTVTEQQIYGITLTANATTIPQYIYDTESGTKTNQSTYALPSSVKIGSVNFSGNTEIRFSPSGSPNYSGYLVLNDTIRNRNRRIDIRPSGSVIGNQNEY